LQLEAWGEFYQYEKYHQVQKVYLYSIKKAIGRVLREE
jgi:hypothetical protein